MPSVAPGIIFFQVELNISTLIAGNGFRPIEIGGAKMNVPTRIIRQYKSPLLRLIVKKLDFSVVTQFDFLAS
jgi:hypothetical protein